MSENVKESRWVWISSDNSIQRGQISVLALLEIPLATAFFWWLSSISPWPWLTLIGLMAAPVLLLRSPESVAAGKTMLWEYWEDIGGAEEISTAQKWLIGLLSACLTVGLSYWGMQYFLLGQTGWEILWRGATLTWVFVVVAGMVAVAVTSMAAVMVSSSVTFATSTVASVVASVVASAAGTLTGAGTVTGMAMAAITDIGTIILAQFALLVVMSAINLGLLVRTIFIRLWATLQYWRSGLATFPRNWHETVCIIDARHLPELLPGAGEVDNDLTLKGLFERLERMLEQKMERGVRDNIIEYMLLTTLVTLIYLPALLYRWNLKASAWLWGPVALLLSPVLWANDEEMRHKTAYWTTWAVQSSLLSVWVGFISWLLAAYLPKDVQALFPHWVTVAYGHFPLPTLGVRYGLLWLLAICLLVLLLTAYPIRAAHGKALEGAGDFHKGYSDELKAELRRLAIPVRYWLRVNLVVITFTIWAFALQWALQRWPNQLQHVVWSWLRPWL